MTPIATDICQALLDHHRWIRENRRPEQRHLMNCVIAYEALGQNAGHPGLGLSVRFFLQEVSAWCAERQYPPLNSLAVNAESRMPGEGYDDAENCSVVNWPAEAAACLAFEDYPEHV